MKEPIIFELKCDIHRDGLFVPAGTEVVYLSEEREYFTVLWEREDDDPVSFSVMPSELKVFDKFGREE